MADQDDVRRIARSLPEAAESDNGFGFSVRGKGFVWAWRERVQPKTARVPRDDVIAVRVDGQEDKAALLASDSSVFFTEPHYNGFPAILIRLEAIGADELEELLTDAWRCQAPRSLVKEFDQRDGA